MDANETDMISIQGGRQTREEMSKHTQFKMAHTDFQMRGIDRVKVKITY